MKKIAYPIRAVSKLTGISIDTLRAWERRYQAVQPARNERERVYAESDVQRLILLRQAVEKGHAISKLAELSDAELEGINSRSAPLTAKPSGAADGFPPGAPFQLKTFQNAVRHLNYSEIDQELNRMATIIPPRDLIHKVVVPLMTEVGDQWCRGDLSIAQEHMLSAALRNLLGSLVRMFAKVQATTLLFAAPKGERHEFGILCAAMLAASGGLGISYLGVDLPGAEIVDTAQKTRARILVLGMKAAISSKEPLKELRRISEKLSDSMEIWVGGIHSASVVREIKSAGAVYFPDLGIFEQELVRFGAQF